MPCRAVPCRAVPGSERRGLLLGVPPRSDGNQGPSKEGEVAGGGIFQDVMRIVSAGVLVKRVQAREGQEGSGEGLVWVQKQHRAQLVCGRDRSHHLGAASCRDVPGSCREQAPEML